MAIALPIVGVSKRSKTEMYEMIIAIFEVKLTFEMLTVRGQQHSFLTHEQLFL